MRLCDIPLIMEETIRSRVEEMAHEISMDYAGEEVTLVVILKGGAIFASHLMQRLRVPVKIEFVRARSYVGTESTGRVELTLVPESELRARHLLVVEDILDTGYTTAAVVDRLRDDEPASVAVCALLNKPSKRKVDVPQNYVGFTIKDHFVVGFGMDYEERYRELPAIHVLEGP